MARGEHSRGVELLSPLAEGAPSSSILFNLAVCQDRQGNRDEATRIYRLLIQDAEYGVYARARLLVLSGELGNDPTSEASERAREEFLAGMEHFQADRIREAIDAFERAYELVHHSRILFNLGVCYQRLGQTLTAASYYHLVLYEEPAEESTREQARLHLDQVLGVDGQIEGGRS
jgi:tetratricopeptide (TPR) repeat protein